MEEQPNFVSHVFNFEKDSRNEMSNIIQYTVLGIVFITALNKGLDEYMPELDKNKSSFSIFIEIAIQCIVLFIGIVFIHRIITFIPTFSGIPYLDQNVISIILPTLILLLSTTNLGKKVNVILDRLFKTPPPPKKNNGTPGTPGSQPPPDMPSLLPKRSNTLNPITEPDFNSMFDHSSTPVQEQLSNDPAPANFGGFGNNLF
jgi:hypothetical protein